MKRIVSAVPGRIRIKDKPLGDRKMAERMAAELEKRFPVRECRINTGACCVVVNYDAALIAPAEMQHRTEVFLADWLARAAPSRRRRPARLVLNSQAKRMALASLSASLASAYTGHTRLHIITGWMFVASLAAHLAVFRRTILR